MTLSKFYSNKPDVFKPVEFVQGLNVILAEIHLSENRDRDTHNLGKSTLGRLLDFAFLAKRDADFFIFKHEKLFEDFIFFLEIKLTNALFVTIRRSVKKASKISFKYHEIGCQDFSTLPQEKWNHYDLPFEKAQELLDGVLNWNAIKPWTFRNGLGYLLRSQDDFKDVFQLAKFKGSQATWKPFLAHLLGFNAELIQQHYEKEKHIEEVDHEIKTYENKLSGRFDDAGKIAGLLQLKREEAEKKQEEIDSLNFYKQDEENTEELVQHIDENIAFLNSKRYSLKYKEKKISSSLKEDKVLFNTNEAEIIFKQAGILFKGQIKKDFDQLLSFNRAITNERRKYLKKEKKEIKKEIDNISTELETLNKTRSDTLLSLKETLPFNKYKEFSDKIIDLRTNIILLEHELDTFQHLEKLRTKLRTLKREREDLQVEIENDIKHQGSNEGRIFPKIRTFFNKIVENVIDRKALLSVSVNKKNGHLDFKTNILDEMERETSASVGTTYKKLLCVAFDLALLHAYKNLDFPRFVYHDGAFEGLDDRKKQKLLSVIRYYANELGFQVIITLIDSDLPPRSSNDEPVFSKDEVILTLHDEGEQGRLFKMKTW